MGAKKKKKNYERKERLKLAKVFWLSKAGNELFGFQEIWRT